MRPDALKAKKYIDSRNAINDCNREETVGASAEKNCKKQTKENLVLKN